MCITWPIRSRQSFQIITMENGNGEKCVPEHSSQNGQLVSPDQSNSTPNNQVDEQPEQQPQQQQQPNGWMATIKTLVVRMLFIYFISTWFRRSPSTPTQKPAGNVATGFGPASNIFPKGTSLDLYIYVSESEKFLSFNDSSSLYWLEEDIIYGEWNQGPTGDSTFIKTTQIQVSEALMKNGSLYIHVYIVPTGKSPNPKDQENYSRRETLYKSKMLTKYKKRKFHTFSNLLTGKSDVHPDLLRKENETTVEILSHWHPNMTLNLVDDQTPWTPGSLPQPLDEYVKFIPGNKYQPILFFNDYWNLNTDYMPINSTTPVLNMTLTFSPMSLIKWQMYAAQGMRNKWYNNMFGDDFMSESDEDQDSLKRTLVETNPYLLGLTIVISIIHSVFEFLAFKNDIQFWKNRKSLEGLSVRSVFFNVFQSVIVVLYVLDNDTNTVVRISVCIGLLIEIWKIHKVVDIKINTQNRLLGVIPRIWFDDKSTYTQSETKKYDQMAFKYLGIALFPLLGGYAVYALLYLEHKGWYSFVLNMLYGFLLTFGFIMMTPQLFINYKLKSVAHLPWRMMTYKALNTFIDDIFAFVIKMPTLYRIGCFRDDIVFFIFLYQRWIYRVDPKRVNEFGVSAEMLQEHDNSTAPGAIKGPSTDSSEDITSAPSEPKTAEDKKRD